MTEMKIVSVGMVQGSDGNVVVLKEKNGGRLLAIGIGIMEASAIAMELEGVKPPRPMTHDLLKNVIARLQARVNRIVIHDLREDTFIGQIELATEMGILEIDARPSDAIALAVRAKVKIYCADEVLETAAIDQEAFNPGGDGDNMVH